MLESNAEFLVPEIMDVIRAYGREQDDFVHYFSYSGGKTFNSIQYDGAFHDFTEECSEEDPIVAKRLVKRCTKLAFYLVLCAKYGDLPWGALTGIRPLKLARMEQREGRDFTALFDKLHVSPANTELCRRIMATQGETYRAGGQDIYVSLPFCPTKCEYCSFITAPIEKTRSYVQPYLECLVKEIYSLRPILRDVRSVYVGGGTPFVLSAEDLAKVYSAIREVMPGEYEFTVEAGRPDVFTDEKLSVSKEYGVNRICVNPQSFLDETLVKIGRRHTAAQTVSAYEMARKYDMDINLDLIAGLADETPEDFAYSVNKAIELRPENITVHTLSLKSGSRLKEETKRLFISGITDMISYARQALTAAGYDPYYLYRQKYQAGGLENTGWTLPGKVCIYNVDTMEEIASNIAVGSGAISKRYFSAEDRIERCAAPKDLPTYIAKTDKLILDRNKLFTEEE
ncbi:MAG: coproporphyrinogen dehydrogenase HemZ [Clostridia bacterium]|nr:coproporphyrinogen dehydrogenase HemZ [Clostridia bacterium]